jgi:hypothetical protein
MTALVTMARTGEVDARHDLRRAPEPGVIGGSFRRRDPANWVRHPEHEAGSCAERCRRQIGVGAQVSRQPPEPPWSAYRKPRGPNGERLTGFGQPRSTCRVRPTGLPGAAGPLRPPAGQPSGSVHYLAAPTPARYSPPRSGVQSRAQGSVRAGLAGITETTALILASG